MQSLLSLAPESTALALNMLLALAVSGVIALCYACWGEALANRAKFARVMPMLSALSVFLIAVKVSAVVKLGVLSSLTIMRFRNPVKDAEELLYLFFAVGVGFGLGVGQRVPTLIAAGVILALLIGKRLVTPKPVRCNLYVNLVAPGPAEGDAALFDHVSAVLGPQARPVRMQRLGHQGPLQMTYQVARRDPQALAQLLGNLQTQLPNCSFSYIDPRPLPDT
jgi:hypothetical protein